MYKADKCSSLLCSRWAYKKVMNVWKQHTLTCNILHLPVSSRLRGLRTQREPVASWMWRYWTNVF